MERKLDEVEGGQYSWIEFLRNFYGDFKTTMQKAEAEMDRVDKPLEALDETCPDCGRNLVIRTGRFGRFVSCSGFPECRYRRSFMNKTGALCPVCNGDLVERKTRQKKRVFYGCGNYPTCTFAMWEKPVPDLCPTCGGLMVIQKVGQEPVCYKEVILPQKSAETRPTQEGEAKAVKPARGTRKKATVEGEDAATALAPKRATASRRKAPSGEMVVAGVNGATGDNDNATEPVSATSSATKSRKTTVKAATGGKTAGRTSSPATATKRAATSRTKATTKSPSTVTAKTKTAK
jgi:DNA topoisomerase-1